MTKPFTFNEDEKYLLELDAKIARAARLKLERYILRILSECYPCSPEPTDAPLSKGPLPKLP